MRSVMLASAFVLLASGAAVGQTTLVAPAESREATAEPIVKVGLVTYRADGSWSGTAYDTPEEGHLDSVVHAGAGGCSVGAGSRHLSATARDAWQFTGEVLSRTPEEVIVQIHWQRTRADGRSVDSPGGSVQLTVRAGDRVPLDSVAPDSGSCAITHVAFEVRYETRLGAARSFGTAASAGGTGGGRGGVAVRSWGGAGVGGKTGAAAGRWWDVDLWLVRKVSGQPESSAHSRLRVTDGAAFAFAPVSLDSPQGPVVVQVTGSFRVQDGAGGPQLLFTTNRRVTVTSAQMPRDRAAGSTGTSTNTLAMPGPDDVVAFELPAVQLPNGGGTIPDQFSVRVRIAPGSTPQPDP